MIRLVKLRGGLLITPNHPIQVSLENGWKKAKDVVSSPHYYYTNEVFNFVLDSTHTIEINGIICATLGHGFKGEKIEHEYFGTTRVIEDLKKIKGWSEGNVEL